ncbi:hypothetical protein ACFV7Q_12010 [Streptomyces sp. NPDC059851]|uniref:hypothetical protein n=1 Tax=Streptomyces sp. NPDC059851 TaxID=3346971 RepID=UPI003666F6C2
MAGLPRSGHAGKDGGTPWRDFGKLLDQMYDLMEAATPPQEAVVAPQDGGDTAPATPHRTVVKGAG